MLLKQKDSALVIIDIQERLARVMKYRDAVIKNSKILIQAAHRLNVPILTTLQYPKGLGPLVSELESALIADTKIEKIHFNCCNEPTFMDRLRGLNKPQVVLVGMESHVCVLQTAISLVENGFGVQVVQDAVASRTKQHWKNGLSRMRHSGVEITTTESALFELLNQAGTPEFKELSALIK
ncbi:Hydrolase [Gammaproteobacteria bacterium]